MDDGKKGLDRHHTLFVYGTLRKGFWNHSFLKGSIFCGMARTKEKYALFVEGIPYVSKIGGGSEIVGEVFQVDGKTLKRIDGLEGHPDWYRREKVQVILENGSNISAWIYFNGSPRGKLVECGDFAKVRNLRGRRA